jgi:hypothetical protein
MITPSCYACQYRRTIPGDCHSRCAHPKVKGGDDFMMALVGTLSGDNIKAADELNIKGNPHGVRMGWFLWPANFDPSWLESCNGFKEK